MGKTKRFATILLMMILLGGCGGDETSVQKPRESETVQAVTEQTAESMKSESNPVSNGEDKTQEEIETMQLTIPESATNGMWVNSYVDIQQKDGKYETKIYLDSVDATDAERLYFTAGVIMELMDREVESGFCVITPSGEYDLDMDTKEMKEAGLPKEWEKFFENDDGLKTVKQSITVDFSDSFENWKKYTFDKYLDDVIIVEEESETEEQKETTTLEEKEEEWETLARKTYSYDDGSETIFLFSKDKEDKFHLTISLNIDEKWKAAYAFTVLCNTIQIDELKEMNALVMLNCGDDTLTSSGLSVDSSGNLIKNSEWLTEGMKSEEFDSQTAEALLDNIKDSFSDFITNEMGKYLS